MSATDDLNALGESLPDDPIEQAVDWLRWRVAQRVMAADGGEHVRERAAKDELDARAALLDVIRAARPGTTPSR